jgi:hypothetical protein
MGRCLFGMGIGQAAEVLILSRLRVGVKGCGEEDRVCPEGIGRGNAMVAISKQLCSKSKCYASNLNILAQHVRSRCRGRLSKNVEYRVVGEVELVGR